MHDRQSSQSHSYRMPLLVWQGCELHEQLQTEAMFGMDDADSWLASARRGLGWLLRSRTAAAQKMSALQV